MMDIGFEQFQGPKEVSFIQKDVRLMKKYSTLITAVISSVLVLNCNNDNGNIGTDASEDWDGDLDTDVGANGYSNADVDTDIDTDADTDADTDTDSDSDSDVDFSDDIGDDTDTIADLDTTIVIEENTPGFCHVNGQVETEHMGYTGSGFCNTDNISGAAIEWRVNAAASGSYRLSWKYANDSKNRPGRILINRNPMAGDVDFPSTGDWVAWGTAETPVQLDLGDNRIRLEAVTEEGLANIDNLTVTGFNPAPADCEGNGDTDIDPDPDPDPDDNQYALNHPGILSSRAELDYIKSQIASNRNPWKDAFDRLANSSYASLSYKPDPFATVKCGSYNKPNVGCNEIVEDGIAAYSHALMWSLTGKQAHADKAIEIIKAWSSVYKANTESNARLVVAWAAPWYANAGELLRHSDSGWKEVEINRLISMLDKFLPYVLNNEKPENNWIQSRVEAHMAIAVFKDDRKELEAAIDRWEFWLPIYIYQSKDGNTPVGPPGRTAAETVNIWESSANSTKFVDGLCMETCRDLGHLGLGFGSMMYAAETAWKQGVDLFSSHKERLRDFMELHGGWMTGSVKVPSTICGGKVKARLSDTKGIAPPSGGGQKAWEIGHGHLADRLGASLPYTKKMLTGNRPKNASKWVTKWETLTHGDIYK